MLRAVFLGFFGCTVASRGGYGMARGRHYAKLSLSNAARLSFSDLCILLFMFLSLCRLCVCVFLCSHWSLVDVPLIFFCPADHVPDWQPRVLLGMVEARSVNVKKTTTTIAYRLRSLPRVRWHRASSPQGSSSNECCLCITMDQMLLCSSLFPHPLLIYSENIQIIGCIQSIQVSKY